MEEFEQKKEITIHKRNEIIKGGNIYSLSAQKLGNAIYHFIQYNRIFQDKVFKIPLTEIREVMGLDNNGNYPTVIKNAVEELAKPIVLYNVDQLTGVRKREKDTLWQVAQFLHDPAIIKEGKEKYLEAKMSPIIRVLMANANEGNFTQLVLNTHLKKVKSKHTYVLYEYLKSLEGFIVLGNKVPLDFDRLNHMFNLEGNPTYHYFSSFKPLLERCVKDLNKNTDMSVGLSVDKSEKKYYIHRFKNKENAKTRNIKDVERGEFEPSELGMFSKKDLDGLRKNNSDI